jgi:MFS family permease
MTNSGSHGWRLTVLWAGIPLVIGALNEYALSVALPSIRAEFGLTLAEVRWIFLVFLIADAAVLVLAGRYGDRVGVRRTFILGLAILALGSVASAAAPGFTWLLIARAVEGVGAGFLFSGILAVVANSVPRETLGQAFGLWALVGAVAVLLSPLIGDGSWSSVRSSQCLLS